MTNHAAKLPLVGVIPAAGKGSRISPLPGSKELFPIGFDETFVDGQTRRYPKVVSQYLVENMVRAGVQQIYMILSEGKWDILKYYGDGQRFGTQFAYLMVEQMIGMPFTINRAYDWVRLATVVFGMPDTIFTPDDAFCQLLSHHEETGSDLTLGLYPTNQPWRFGMVDINPQGRALACIDKPESTSLKYMWGSACWAPRFTEFLNEQINGILEKEPLSHELVLGDFFQRAIEEDMNVQTVCFDQGEYVDIGSPQELEQTVKRFVK